MSVFRTHEVTSLECDGSCQPFLPSLFLCGLSQNSPLAPVPVFFFPLLGNNMLYSVTKLLTALLDILMCDGLQLVLPCQVARYPIGLT